jgi:hypothetical protein
MKPLHTNGERQLPRHLRFIEGVKNLKVSDLQRLQKGGRIK